MESSLNRPDDPWKRGAARHNRRRGCSRVVNHQLPRAATAHEAREVQGEREVAAVGGIGTVFLAGRGLSSRTRTGKGRPQGPIWV